MSGLPFPLNAGENGAVKVVTDSNFESVVLKSKKPVLVDFWATWCGPCRMYGPIVDQVAVDYKGRVKVARVDVDQNPELSRKFGIQAIPTSIVFKKGKILDRWMGFVPKEDVSKSLDSVLQSK